MKTTRPISREFLLCILGSAAIVLTCTAASAEMPAVKELARLKNAAQSVSMDGGAESLGIDRVTLRHLAPEALKNLRPPLAKVEEKLEAAGKAVAGLVPVTNLHVDTRRRDLRFDMLHAKTRGGLTVDVEGRSHMGRLPVARFAVADRAIAAGMEAEVSHNLEHISLSGRWNVGAAAFSGGLKRESESKPLAATLLASYRLNSNTTLSGALNEEGRYAANVSLALTRSQTLSYSVKSGPATEHRVGWSLRVKL